VCRARSREPNRPADITPSSCVSPTRVPAIGSARECCRAAGWRVVRRLTGRLAHARRSAGAATTPWFAQRSVLRRQPGSNQEAGNSLAGRGAVRVYAGSTPLPSKVFGRQRGRGDPLDSCGFARPGTTRADRRSKLVMRELTASPGSWKQHPQLTEMRTFWDRPGRAIRRSPSQFFGVIRPMAEP
jgi:hypothetical protein